MRRYACGILLRGGHILLGKRAPHRKAYAGCWDVIGGLVEEGEAVAAALRREFREEVGIEPVSAELLCHLVDHGPQMRGEATYHMHVVRSWTGGEPVMANDEHTVLAWFTIDEARALPGLALPEYAAVFSRIRTMPPGS